MKGMPRRQKRIVRPNVHRQKFDLQLEKLKEELRKAKKSLASSRKPPQ